MNINANIAKKISQPFFKLVSTFSICRSRVESFYHKTKRHARTDRRLDPFGEATQFTEAAMKGSLFWKQNNDEKTCTVEVILEIIL